MERAWLEGSDLLDDSLRQRAGIFGKVGYKTKAGPRFLVRLLGTNGAL